MPDPSPLLSEDRQKVADAYTAMEAATRAPGYDADLLLAAIDAGLDALTDGTSWNDRGGLLDLLERCAYYRGGVDRTRLGRNDAARLRQLREWIGRVVSIRGAPECDEIAAEFAWWLREQIGENDAT